jgi:FlaG/FlaF family flagellin (archaellin)
MNGGSPDPTTETPVANWNTERVNATHVRITHAGGDPVETDGLLVTVDGNERSVTWSRTLFPGDAGVVRARVGTAVELYWQPDRSTDRTLLRTWDV